MVWQYYSFSTELHGFGSLPNERTLEAISRSPTTLNLNCRMDPGHQSASDLKNRNHVIKLWVEDFSLGMTKNLFGASDMDKVGSGAMVRRILRRIDV